MKKYFLIVSLLVSLQITAQQKWFSGSFNSNSQYYVNDSKTGDFTEDDRFRSNNYLKLDAIYKNFTFGIQIEGYAPQAILNYSPSFDKEIGLSSFYANYKTKNLDVTVGNFYEQFGNGLVLRSWEDRQLGINNALLGGKIKYSPTQNIHLTALYGKQKKDSKFQMGKFLDLILKLIFLKY